MQTLQQLVDRGALQKKRVFIRADLNVPQDASGKITDDARIRASQQAVQMALDAGAAVMITSHLGRPTEGQFEQKWSLAPVAGRLSQLLEKPVKLQQNWVDGVDINPGQVVMLENSRLNKGEKSNDPQLAKKIAGLCDIYVNDAFATAHRAEATTAGIAQYAPTSCAGPLLQKEVQAITTALQNPARPLTVIIGGSKVSTKLTLLENLANKVDRLIVGGGIANTFLMAAGHPIGASLVEKDLQQSATEVMKTMNNRRATVPLPQDVVVAKEFSATAEARTIPIDKVEDDDMILDIGPQTAAKLASQLDSPGTIVWNGPVGVFEIANFAGGTKKMAEAIAQSPSFTLAGGGDTLAAISTFGIAEDIDYISTGGGAFLEMLEGKQLPALAALEGSQ